MRRECMMAPSRVRVTRTRRVIHTQEPGFLDAFAQRPASTIGPDGRGTPPSGSIVTATVTGASSPATSEASWRVTPPSVGANTPADTGVLPEITHAWYVRSAGRLGRSYAYRINVRVSGL